MSGASWYYLEAGSQAGPVEEEAILGMIRSGRLPAGAQVWRDGMSDWQPWSSIPELASAAPSGVTAPSAPSAPPPRPPPAAPQAYGQQFVYPKAPLGARFVAYLVDAFLFLLPAILLLILTAVAIEKENGLLGGICGILGGLLMLAAVVYGFIKDGRANGQSVGKKMMRLMVVHLPTNQPCTKGQSAGRAAIMMLLGFIPYVGSLIEPIVVLAAGDGRRLGDKAANTQVVAVDDYRRRFDVDAFS
jgi:uncharacterized RDD family membrane protein YckC